MMKLPIYKIKPLLSSFTAVALVEDPAIEELFMAFESEKEQISIKFSDDEKKIVSGPAMIPNKLIYRSNPQCYVMYDEVAIVEFAKQFIQAGAKFNLEHQDELVEVNIIESYFLKESNDWDLPQGTWIVSAKIEDDKIWEDVKSGKFKGFSIQSNFLTESIEEFKNQNIKDNEMINELKEQLNSLLFKVNEMEAKFVDVTVDPAVEAPAVEDNVEDKDPMIKELTDKVVDLEAKVTELETKIVELMASYDARILALEESLNANVTKVEEMSRQKIDVTETEKVEIFSGVKEDSPMKQFFK